MKKILLSVAILATFAFTSCKSAQEIVPTPAPKLTTNITVPVGFNWESSRNVNFTVSVTDTRFQTAIYTISIYNGDPSTGANLLAKGSATNSAAFSSKIYTANSVTQVYIVKTAPDNTKTTQKVQIGTADVIASIGI